MQQAQYFSSDQLLECGRELTLPFKLLVKAADSEMHLQCQKILRVLPGKRLVCLAKDTHNQQPVVVKIFFDPKGARRHFQRELSGNLALQSCDLSTPSLVFSGQVADRGYAIVFEYLEGIESPAYLLEHAHDDTHREKLLSELVTVIARQHQHGIKQDDLHLNNFPRRDDTVFVIDGGGVDAEHRGSTLNKALSLDNLALFFAQLLPHFDRHIETVYDVYAQQRQWRAKKRDIEQLKKRVLKRRESRVTQYLEKVFRDCTAFMAHDSWSLRWVCDRAEYSSELAELIADPEALMAKGHCLKNGNSATVVRVRVGDRDWVIKRYNLLNTMHRLKRSLQTTRAAKSWRNAHLLTMLGLHTPKPIALIEKREGLLRDVSYYISEYVEAPNSYEVFTAEHSLRNYDTALVNAFVDLFDDFRQCRISHGDCKALNFLVLDGQPWVVDLDAMERHSSQIANRASHRRDIQRFLKNWRAFPGLNGLFKEKLGKYL